LPVGLDAFREHDGYEYANTIGQFFVTRYGFDKMIKPTEVNMILWEYVAVFWRIIFAFFVPLREI